MALTGLGVLALRQGESALAVTQFTRAVKIDPSDVNFLLLADALRRAGRPAEADSALTQARRISPDLSRAQFTAGQLLSFAGLQPL
jgi:Flp pilus assembly protein TadD